MASLAASIGTAAQKGPTKSVSVVVFIAVVVFIVAVAVFASIHSLIKLT